MPDDNHPSVYGCNGLAEISDLKTVPPTSRRRVISVTLGRATSVGLPWGFRGTFV